jgi:hypothetical protein
MLSAERLLRSQYAICSVEAWDRLEMVVIGQHNSPRMQRAGGDVDVLNGQIDALAVQGPGEFQGFFPAFGGGIEVEHDRPSALIVLQPTSVAQSAPDFGLDEATGRDVPGLCQERQGAEWVVAVAGLLNVPATVHEDGAAHGDRCQGLAVTL